MSGWRDRLGPLSERNFRLLILGQWASYVGDGIVPVAISFAVIELTGSVADIGFVFAARLLPLACLLLIGGVASDRFARRTVMVLADVIRFIGQGALAMMLLSGQARVWHVLVLQAVHGTASAFFMPAVTGLVPDTVGAERLQEANALRWAALSSGNVLGPAVAGILVASVGAGIAIAVDAATFVVSAGFLLALRLPAHTAGERQSLLGDLAAGWREFVARRWLIAANVIAALGNALVIAPFLVAGPAIANAVLGGAEAWALIAAAFGSGSIVGGVIAMRIRTRRPMLVGLALVALHAVPTGLLALRAPAAVVAVGALAAGAQPTVLNTLWETTLQGLVPSHLLSRIAAYDWASSTVVAPLGFVLAGVLAGSALGVSGTLWLAAAVALLLAAATPLVRSVRTLEMPGPTERAGTRG